MPIIIRNIGLFMVTSQDRNEYHITGADNLLLMCFQTKKAVQYLLHEIRMGK